MSRSRADVTAVVLAGGASRRFGSDKLSADLGGRPLLHHPIERLLDVCEEVVVVLSPGGEEPSVPAGSVVFARDGTDHEGPLAGLVAGLASVGSERAVVAGGDMPGIEPEVVRELLRASEETGAVVAILSDGGDARPLPCVVRTGPALTAARRLLADGRRRLRDLLAETSTVLVDEPTWTALDPERRTLLDVDEPSDLDR
ncbi:MAG TPA: molybdenum cofactor guanylyltransferase [Actinomycetota bacterium]